MPETVEASIALINMWDYKLPLDKLMRMTCLTKGNLKSMDDMSVSGPTSLRNQDRKSTRLNSSHVKRSRMPSSA